MIIDNPHHDSDPHSRFIPLTLERCSDFDHQLTGVKEGDVICNSDWKRGFFPLLSLVVARYNLILDHIGRVNVLLLAELLFASDDGSDIIQDHGKDPLSWKATGRFFYLTPRYLTETMMMKKVGEMNYHLSLIIDDCDINTYQLYLQKQQLNILSRDELHKLKRSSVKSRRNRILPYDEDGKKRLRKIEKKKKPK